MSFGFGVSDFVTLPAFARKVYRACRDAPGGFKTFSDDIVSLHAILKEIEERLPEFRLNQDQEARLAQLGKGCNDVLKDLESLIKRYHSLGTQTQRTWDRMGWGLEQTSDLRGRLNSNVTMLSAFLAALARCDLSASDWPQTLPLANLAKRLTVVIQFAHYSDRECSASAVRRSSRRETRAFDLLNRYTRVLVAG